MTIRAGLLSLALLMGATALPDARGSSAERPAFQFDQKRYFLRSAKDGILEYLPEQDTFEKWHTLISIREFSGTDDPQAYAEKLIEHARASGPNAQGRLMENKEAGSYIADFLVYSGKGSEPPFAEWNLWRVERKGEGVEAVQYARRFYEITDSTPKELTAARGKIVPELAAFAIEETPTAEGGEPPDFDARRLVGIHPVSGRNPDGTAYKGTVEIRVVNGLVGLEWKIGDTISHGNGVLVGMTLGVALDDGLAIYRIFGQSEGQSLIGCWAGAESSTTSEEAILIGNADMTRANVPAEEINGKYFSLRQVNPGQIEGQATISGGDIAKKVLWKVGGKTSKCRGLALGDGFAVLTPTGLSVFERRPDKDGAVSLVGTAVTGDAAISQESLIPVK